MFRTVTRIALTAALCTITSARGQDVSKTQAFVLARNNYTELTFKTTFSGPFMGEMALPGRPGDGIAVTIQLIRMADGRPVVVKEATTSRETRGLSLQADLEANMTYTLVAKHTGTSTALVSGKLAFQHNRPKPLDPKPDPAPTKKPTPAPTKKPLDPKPTPTPAATPDLNVSDVRVDQADNSIKVVIGNNGDAKASAVSVQLDLWLNGKVVYTRTADVGAIGKGATEQKKFKDLGFAQVKAIADKAKRAGGPADLMWSVTPKVTAGVPDTNTADNYKEETLILK